MTTKAYKRSRLDYLENQTFNRKNKRYSNKRVREQISGNLFDRKIIDKDSSNYGLCDGDCLNCVYSDCIAAVN